MRGVRIALIIFEVYCLCCFTLQAAWWLGNAQQHTQQLQVSSLAVWQNVSRRLRSIIMAGATEPSVQGERSCSYIMLRCQGHLKGWHPR